MKKVFLLATLLFCMATINAQTVRKTAKNQRHRIVQGVKSGELTKAETVNLVKQQKEIHQDVKDAKADGVVTKDERRDIKKDQNKASRTIARKKHNSRDRN
jgi:hypothetical protein